MNPVLADWLTLVLAPIGVALLLAAFFSARAASTAKQPVPPWTKVAQSVAILCVLLVAVLKVLGD